MRCQLVARPPLTERVGRYLRRGPFRCSAEFASIGSRRRCAPRPCGRRWRAVLGPVVSTAKQRNAQE